MLRRFGSIAAVAISAWLFAAPTLAQAPEGAAADAPSGVVPVDSDLYALDFNNVELAVVIDAIAKLTNKNFIYDDRVRGRVTIVSPTPVSIDQAYAVFESVLQVKGFTTVVSPGGAIKVIPVREAKESNIETVRSSLPPPDRDRFVTRLIPLRYIDADSIVNTLKPLVSKDASMAAYVETNTVILTESASNIRRLLAILEAIDVETYKEELAVLKVEYADATALADQVSQIYGAEVSQAASTGLSPRGGAPRRAQVPGIQVPPIPASPSRGRVRIITDTRTNSLIVLAAKAQLEDVRALVRKLDVPVTGGGRIHVYYLQYADAEELAQTLAALISGQVGGSSTGGGNSGLQPGGGIPQVSQAQPLRTVVAGLADGITVTADPATNALVIQASQEGYATIAGVIEKLDIERPQVLVEALIMEVDITDGTELGFNGLFRLINGDTDITIAQVADSAAAGAIGGGGLPGAAAGAGAAAVPFLMNFFRRTFDVDKDGNPTSNGSLIQGIIRASASDAGTNIISAPHILTSDNEEAEIRIGNNIPIISSRVQAPTTGGSAAATGLSTSVNVERQDIGVTLRVTPQITEGDSLRLDIFQEITSINKGLQSSVGNVDEVGVPLASRKVENTVMVGDNETVVIGGLISDLYDDSESKVPWLGDVPILGWAFKSTTRSLQKVNLLVFLTPHIVRTRADLERETIRKREEFESDSGPSLELSESEVREQQERRAAAEAAGETFTAATGRNPVRNALLEQEARYPLERMHEIEQQQQADRERARAQASKAGPRYFVQAPVVGDESAATRALTDLVDAGFDGTLVSSQTNSGLVLYEIHLGPFETLDEAQRVGTVVQTAHGLSSSVIVEPEPEMEKP